MSASFDDLIHHAFGEGYYGEGRDQPREMTRFLNMAVESFDVSTQWSGGSTLDITLYEDFCGDADGKPPAVFGGQRQAILNDKGEYTVVDTPLYNTEDMIGAPYRFSMGQFEFCGLLQRIVKADSSDGKQEWKVQLVSPDQSPSNLVSKIDLIISGYYNDLGFDNLFNVGREVEKQKSSLYQSYMWWYQWLQDEYEHYFNKGQTARYIERHGFQNALERARLQALATKPIYSSDIALQMTTNSIGALADKVDKELLWLNHIPHTVYGSLYYQEVLWAFNKLQQEIGGVRFTHRNVSPHPDLLIEDHYGWDGRYFVDISELPGGRNSTIPMDKVPQGFRIDGPSITLEDFVKHICGEDGFRLDYIWELRPSEIKRCDIQLGQLHKIRNAKEQSLVSNKKDPYPDTDIKTIDKEIEEISNKRQNLINTGDIAHRLPIIKLKVFPQGNNLLLGSNSGTRQIVRTITGLQQQGIGVTNHSVGLECAEDMPSLILSGGQKEIMVVASNNLLHFRSYTTGNPMYGAERATVVPSRRVIEFDSPGDGVKSEYPSVWRMYFGQDRYNNAQVMFSELFTLPFNLRKKTKVKTTHQLNYVWLDTYELQSQLRFFVEQKGFKFYDYIKVSENEIRCGIDFDLFWWSVCATGGDLCNLFINSSIVDPLVIESILLHDSTMTAGISKMLSNESAQRMQVGMMKTLINKIYSDRLNNVGTVPCPMEMQQIIREDLQCIQKWINDKYSTYYGKQYVTPFYFRDITEMFDENGNYIKSYEPQEVGFREYGGSDFLGLRQHDTLTDGVRGLEVFTGNDGKTQAFVRFYDPDREIDIDQISLKNMVRTQNDEGDFLCYKVQKVEHIRNQNLVKIELDSPIFERLSISGSFLGVVDVDQMANFINSFSQSIQDPAERNRFLSMAKNRLDANGPNDPWLQQHFNTYMMLKTNVGSSYSISSTSPKARFPVDGCYGVKCHFINYGPWIVKNGNNPGKYEQDEGLTPWKFGTQLLDPEEAHNRMNDTGLLKLANRMMTHKYAHVGENGTLAVAGYPSIPLGAEIANLIEPDEHGRISSRTSESFGGLFGLSKVDKYIGGLPKEPYGDTYTEYSIDEVPYTGKRGPNVTRITVNADGQGNMTTTYTMSKNTPKDGMMAKHFMDRIQRISQLARGRIDFRNIELERLLDLEIKRYEGFKSRKTSFDFAAGRRSNRFSPHDVIMAQNVPVEYPRINPDTGRIETINIVREKAESGVGAVDIIPLISTPDHYFQKAFMSMDGLVAPYATTDTKEGLLLEIELRREQARREGRELTAAEEQDIKDEVFRHGTLNIPHFKKPTNTKGTVSVSDGPRFQSYEDIKKYNEQGGDYLGGHPINSQFLNPLVNPAEVDNNDLMTHPVGKDSDSTFGHVVSDISRGLTRPKYINFMKNLEKDISPYSTHYQGIGLNAPVVITGWGYNTEGQPVPRGAKDAAAFAKDWAARKDLHVTGALDIRFDEDRGVWTIPTPRMYYVVMVEDMQIKDMTARNKQERDDFDHGYDRGLGAGKQDKQTEINNRNRSDDDQLPLDARLNGNFNETDENWVAKLNDTIRQGYDLGYEHGFYDLTRPKQINKPNKRIFGPARILNSKSWTEGFINVDTLAGVPLKKGEKCMAWQDGSDIDENGMVKYYAIPTGLTMDVGIVMQSIMPTGDVDENNELTGGGLVLLNQGSEPVRAYCGMVLESNQAIPEGAVVELINCNSVMRIINRIC